jgi:alginate O-acetyltransferase complex protein AlgI
MARALTFISVVVAWVLFRAESLDGAWVILKAMGGYRSFSVGPDLWSKIGALAHSLGPFGPQTGGLFPNIPNTGEAYVWFAVLLPVVLFAPTTQQIMWRYRPALETYSGEIGKAPSWLRWRPNWVWTLTIVVMALIGTLYRPLEAKFLYFNF